MRLLHVADTAGQHRQRRHAYYRSNS
jgi:hypothetical protein